MESRCDLPLSVLLPRTTVAWHSPLLSLGSEGGSVRMNRHHKRRRFAALAACVGSTAAIAVLGTAGPALATVPCRTGGFASGSSFQGTAMQTVWLPGAGWGTPNSRAAWPPPSSLNH